MKAIFRSLTGTGRLMGLAVTATSGAIVWTLSGTARLLIRPFTC